MRLLLSGRRFTCLYSLFISDDYGLFDYSIWCTKFNTRCTDHRRRTRRPRRYCHTNNRFAVPVETKEKGSQDARTWLYHESSVTGDAISLSRSGYRHGDAELLHWLGQNSITFN